jgi:hypothetical protein
MTDVVVRLRPDQVEPLDRFAAQDGRSRSNAVQRAVDLLLERQRDANPREHRHELHRGSRAAAARDDAAGPGRLGNVCAAADAAQRDARVFITTNGHERLAVMPMWAVCRSMTLVRIPTRMGRMHPMGDVGERPGTRARTRAVSR